MSSKQPSLTIVHKPTDQLRPSDRNAKQHPERQLKKLAKYIKQVGFRKPIDIDPNGEVLCGHARLVVAQRLGMREVPCVVHEDLSTAEKRAFRLADNRLAELGTYDADMLSQELAALEELGVDLAAIGFNIDNEQSSEDAMGEANAKLPPSLQYNVVVECADEAQQNEVLTRLEGEGLTCRPWIV
jgi:ParB-like chromosome segregation protein Spo0J